MQRCTKKRTRALEVVTGDGLQVWDNLKTEDGGQKADPKKKWSVAGRNILVRA